jgi:hypothetical protein
MDERVDSSSFFIGKMFVPTPRMLCRKSTRGECCLKYAALYS